MTPADSAARMPCAPVGANPPPAVKLPLWKLVNSSAKIVIVGIRSFQIIVMLLVSASHFTPMTFTTVKKAMNSKPHKMPAVVSVPLRWYNVEIRRRTYLEGGSAKPQPRSARS